MNGGINMLGDQASWEAFCAKRQADAERYESWGPHMRALWDYLQETGTRIGGVTFGDDPDATPEDRAETLLASLKEVEAALERGDIEEYDIGAED